MKDSLTGLRNREAFQERLEDDYRRSLRHCVPLALLLLEVDNFGDYITRCGKARGDEALRQLAETIRGVARTTDYVARWHSERFALLLPFTEARGAMQLADRLHENLADWPTRDESLTVSIGVASVHPLLVNADMLMDEANRALRVSRVRGRDRPSHSGVPEVVSAR